MASKQLSALKPMLGLISACITLLLITAACGDSRQSTPEAAAPIQPPEAAAPTQPPVAASPTELPASEWLILSGLPTDRNAKFYFDLSVAHIDKEEYEQASNLLYDALQRNPQYAPAYRWQGFIASAEERFEDAVREYGDAIRHNSEYAEAYRDRGLVYFKLFLGRRAIQDFDEALRLNPGDASAHLSRGDAYTMVGESQRAVQDYDEAIQIDPQDAPAYLKRGDYYFDLGENQRAIQDYDEAIRLDPQPLAYIQRGRAYSWLDRHESAIRDLDEAIRLDPGNARAHWARGYAVAGKLPNWPDTTADWERARQLDSGFCPSEPPIEPEVMKVLKSAYYRQFKDFNGISIMANDKVDPQALAVISDRLETMFSNARPDLLPRIAEAGVEIVVIPKDDPVSILPEYSGEGVLERRGVARQYGAAISEENLLKLPSNAHVGYDTAFHEIGHVFMSAGFTDQDIEILVGLYDQAKLNDLFLFTYALTIPDEFWGEITGSYFGGNPELGSPGELRIKAPDAFAFLDHIYRNQPLPDSVAALAR